jgi:hypothetical protein
MIAVAVPEHQARPVRPPVVDVARVRRVSHARLARRRIEDVLAARGWPWSAAASRTLDYLLQIEEGAVDVLDVTEEGEARLALHRSDAARARPASARGVARIAEEYDGR